MKEAAIAGCLVLLITLGVYGFGYFAGSDLDPTFRIFKHRWLYNIYWPAVRVEALVRGKDFRAGYVSRIGTFSLEVLP